ncbi:MAG: 1-acyl-sn-glycerol-3-phosphate acyltransferase [Chloroflexota bacterium]|nr:1-acyl-sn-glycerol-3-phosphate acyltransferase [Chloroflexota bacterium]
MIEPILDKNLNVPRRLKHAGFVSARWIVLPGLRVGLRMKVFGLDNIPKRGGALVICNHLGWFDPVLLVAASLRPMLWMAKAEFIKYPFLRWMAYQTGAFPVRRGQVDRQALRHAQQLLDDGMLVGMFPEGTRSRTGGLIEPFGGASLIALRAHAPIIPCALIGTERLPLSGFKPAHRRYPKVTALFGEPFTLEHIAPDGTKRSLDDLTDAMMIEIARILPEQYRGIYADHCDAPHPAVRRDTIVFTGLDTAADS